MAAAAAQDKHVMSELPKVQVLSPREGVTSGGAGMVAATPCSVFTFATADLSDSDSEGEGEYGESDNSEWSCCPGCVCVCGGGGLLTFVAATATATATASLGLRCAQTESQSQAWVPPMRAAMCCTPTWPVKCACVGAHTCKSCTNSTA